MEECSIEGFNMYNEQEELSCNMNFLELYNVILSLRHSFRVQCCFRNRDATTFYTFGKKQPAAASTNRQTEDDFQRVALVAPMAYLQVIDIFMVSIHLAISHCKQNYVYCCVCLFLTYATASPLSWWHAVQFIRDWLTIKTQDPHWGPEFSHNELCCAV